MRNKLFQWLEVCMSENWYYVQQGNRQGPVSFETIQSLIRSNTLGDSDYVWKKGFDNWKKIREVSELSTVEEGPGVPPMISKIDYIDPKLSEFDPHDRSLFIRIGMDRGGQPNDYGPFTLEQLKKLFKENRINGKTLLFKNGMKEWKLLGDFEDYQEIFEEVPPMIAEEERRSAIRKPFVARMFVHNNETVFEGICRDISIGGMQVLTDQFKGKEGDRISINVHPQNTDYHFTASGMVVRLLEGNAGFSFRFLNLSDEARKSIEKYIEEN
ncbi:MAG TPA: GYF domain-containing protein [Bacteriovoracaceae bacterium]|nr:GYF domain-containing protein [Bacteriovoracaceae bacterium]HLW56340.1 GYF domain-containing protein [Bacteriovoracaceae bacterium]